VVVPSAGGVLHNAQTGPEEYVTVVKEAIL
jgi:hypothetical protein